MKKQLRMNKKSEGFRKTSKMRESEDVVNTSELAGLLGPVRRGQLTSAFQAEYRRREVIIDCMVGSWHKFHDIFGKLVREGEQILFKADVWNERSRTLVPQIISDVLRLLITKTREFQMLYALEPFRKEDVESIVEVRPQVDSSFRVTTLEIEQCLLHSICTRVPSITKIKAHAIVSASANAIILAIATEMPLPRRTAMAKSFKEKRGLTGLKKGNAIPIAKNATHPPQGAIRRRGFRRDKRS